MDRWIDGYTVRERGRGESERIDWGGMVDHYNNTLRVLTNVI